MLVVNIKRIAWYFLCYISILFSVFILGTKTFLIFVIAIVGTLPFVRATISRSSDMFSPKVLLPFTYTLYALGPLQASVQYPKHEIIHYLLLQLLGLFAMYLGLHIAIKRKFNPDVCYALEPLRGRTKVVLLLTFVIIMFLSAVSLVSYFITFGGITSYIKVGYGGDFYLTLQEKGMVIGAGFEWCLLGAALVLFYGIKKPYKSYLVGGITIFTFVSSIILLTGRRHQFVYPLLFALTLFHYGYRRLSPPLVLVGILIGISVAQYYALARFFLPKGLIYALTQTWSVVVKNFHLIAPWSANEFRMPAASLLEVLHYGSPGLLLGRSYIASLGAPIPFLARLVKQFGFDVNEWRMATFYPLIWIAGGGLGFSPVTESYLNFGVVGIFLHLFLYGYIIGRIYNRFLTKPSWSTLFLLAGSFPMFMLEGMRIHTASFVWKWVRIYLMPWTIFIILKVLLPKQPVQSYTLSTDFMQTHENIPE